MGGSTAAGAVGVYGTRGVSSASSYPSARAEAVLWYDDSEREIWLFGGDGYSTSNFGAKRVTYSDLSALL